MPSVDEDWVDFDTMRARAMGENLFLARIVKDSGDLLWLYYITDPLWQCRPDANIEELWLVCSPEDAQANEEEFQLHIKKKLYNILEKQ